MKFNDAAFGGFIVSKNVNRGRPIRYTYREKSSIPDLNGWTIYSCDDDQKYVEDANNFIILGANSIYKIAPVMLEIFDAPYGTDLCWMYEANKHVGFYDLIKNQDTTIDEILERDLELGTVFEFANVTENSSIQSVVDEFLKAYSGGSFLNGLYRIHKAADIAKWTEIVRKAFPKFKGKIIVFGFDWLGRNFAIDIERNVVLLFEPGTGEMFNTEVDFMVFHNKEISESHDACLASSFFKDWYEANNNYVLKHHQCAGYKVPLFLNGKDTVENLEVSDMEVYWEIMMPLMNL